jgi:hypothetical protein
MSRTLTIILVVLACAGAVTLALFYAAPRLPDPFDDPQRTSPISDRPQTGLMSRAPDQERSDEGTAYLGALTVEGQYRVRAGAEKRACFTADKKYEPDLPEKERQFCFTNTEEALSLLASAELAAGCYVGSAAVTFERLFVAREGTSEAKLLEVISLTAQRETSDCP